MKKFEGRINSVIGGIEWADREVRGNKKSRLQHGFANMTGIVEMNDREQTEHERKRLERAEKDLRKLLEEIRPFIPRHVEQEPEPSSGWRDASQSKLRHARKRHSEHDL